MAALAPYFILSNDGNTIFIQRENDFYPVISDPIEHSHTRKQGDAVCIGSEVRLETS